MTSALALQGHDRCAWFVGGRDDPENPESRRVGTARGETEDMAGEP